MASVGEIEDTVERLLVSKTFEAEELPRVLAKRGYAEAEVSAAVERVLTRMADDERRPAHRRSVAAARRGNHLIRIGVLTLIVGLLFSLVMGWGLLQLLLVVAVGGAFIAAGYRGLRHGRAPRRPRG